MKPVLELLNNLTVISVFQLIFMQQNYRIVNFYSNTSISQSEILNKIIRISSNSIKPFKHMNIDEINKNRESYEEPILNVLVVNEINDIMRFNRTHLFGTTVIWSSSKNADKSYTMPQWPKLSSQVILITDSFLYTANNFLSTKINKMNLLHFNKTLTNKFLKTLFSKQSIKGSNVTIFTEFNAPKSEFTRIDDNYFMIGPDGVIAEALVEWLNMTPIFSSSVGIKHPNYQEWLNSSILSLRLRYQHYHSMVLTKNVVTIFNDDLRSSFDVMLTSFPHQGRNFSKRIGLKSEALYPHDIDCLTAIVPQQGFSNHFLRKVVNYADTQAIFVVLFLFIIFRIILQKASWHQGFVISIKTIGVFLNQSKIENDNHVKVAWDINLRAFSLLATTALSAIIFKSLVTTDNNEINTIDDLIASNLTIYAPNYLKHQDIWEHMRASLRSKIKFTTANDIEHSLVDEQKFNSAYIYHKAKGEYITMIANSKVPAGSRQRVRLMNKQIHCGLASYRISENSPLTPYANTLLRTFLENGVYVKQLEWMQNLNQAVFHIKQNEPPKRENVVLTWKMLVSVFILYAVGVAIATFTFFIEIIFGFYFRTFTTIFSERCCGGCD